MDLAFSSQAELATPYYWLAQHSQLTLRATRNMCPLPKVWADFMLSSTDCLA